MFRAIIKVLLLSLLFSMPAYAAVIHVPGDEPTIQAGIDAASEGDTVLVADGTYAGYLNREISFRGKAITVRSSGGANRCVINCQNEGRAFNFHCGEGRDSVLQGFTIKNGDVRYDEGGALLFTANSSPTIRENIISENQAEFGAAIYCHHASPAIVYNTISNNFSTQNGGAFYCTHYSHLLISNNMIIGNTALRSAPGIYCREFSSPIITNNIIRGNTASSYSNGGGIICVDSAAVISNNEITSNAALKGAGVYCFSSYSEESSNALYPVITYNYIALNAAEEDGGGIYCYHGEPVIACNVVSGNSAGEHGGGLCAYSYADPKVANNLFIDNTASLDGGGICCHVWAAMNLVNNTIVNNTAGRNGGGFYCGHACASEVSDTILWNNQAPAGKEIYLGTVEYPSTLTIVYSDVEGGQGSVFIDPGSALSWGPGMMNADPLFVTGGEGGYYLSQTAAGQISNSPCLNAGSRSASGAFFRTAEGYVTLSQLTTRTDHVPDAGRVDMGYHYGNLIPPETIILSGPENTVNAPVVTFTFTGTDEHDPPTALLFSYRMDQGAWSDFGDSTRATFTGLSEGLHTFRVRARDSYDNVDPTPAERQFTMESWDSDESWENVVTGPGPGLSNPPLVRTAQAQWLAYGVTKSGVNVACGDTDQTGPDEVLTGPGPGLIFGPHVRGWRLEGPPLPGLNFMAYGTRKFGVNVTAGDIDGDGYDEILTGAGPGPVFGPHVRGWHYDNSGHVAPIPGVSFFAYSTRKYGVNITCGNIDGDAYDEIITGAGPGSVFGPHVRGFDYDGSGETISIGKVSFFAYDTRKYGVNVSCGELDGDLFDEIVTAPGPGPSFPAHVLGWNYDNEAVSYVSGVNFFAYTSKYGTAVSTGDTDGDGRDEILTMPGPGPSNTAHARGWDYEGGMIVPMENINFKAYDPWMKYGGKITGGHLNILYASKKLR